MENLQERINKKEQQIIKMEKNLKKYVVDDEFTAMCDRYFQTKDFTELNIYKKQHNLFCLPEYYSKRHDLENAKETLEKYKKQLIVENDKKATLSKLPESIQTFRASIIARWNAYDYWKKEEIHKIYHDSYKPYTEAKKELFEKFGRGWYEFMYLTDEQIAKQNQKDADALILNMIERVIKLTGTITDTNYLYLDRDNSGYTIINGFIIGEKGKAKIESILAGGYNIQKLHVRVLIH